MSGLPYINLKKAFNRLWRRKPLVIIMTAAIVFRLLAVIFAKGWGMMDDHFIVIESAQSWVDGKDYNDWLPGSPSNTGPTGHNFFYPGLHFMLFSFFRFIGLDDPQLKMMLVRFFHAAWSLVTVFFGYKITERLGNRRAARLAGILLAILWFMPWLSVRNMVEITCIPFLILAVWFIISREDNPAQQAVFFIAGLFLGFAFNLRPQTLFFSAGIFITIILQKKWNEVIGLILGMLIPVILIQGSIDYVIWGKPFVEIIQYFAVNFQDAQSYITLPWYNYFLVVLGLLIPPVSVFLFVGFLRNWRKNLLLFLPVVLFFIMHSYFPNKQERFIMPIIPFIIILGVIGWNEYIDRSPFWQNHMRWLRGGWMFFWIINLSVLPIVSVVYSKRARVETMSYLSKYPDIKHILVDDEGNSPEMFPRFYLGQWPYMSDELLEGENSEGMMGRVAKEFPDFPPRFVLITGDKLTSAQVIAVRKFFPFLVYETTIEPGMIDKIVHWLNPINKNRRVYIYRNTCFYPEKKE